MRHQRRELGLNGRVVFVVRTDQRPVPFPATGFRWLNEQQHLTLEEVKNPLVFERLHVFESDKEDTPAADGIAPMVA
jgi:hypothetical protein